MINPNTSILQTISAPRWRQKSTMTLMGLEACTIARQNLGALEEIYPKTGDTVDG